MTAIRIGTIALLIAAFFWLAGYFVGDYFYGKSEPEQPKEEWCEVGEINERGELVYQQNYAGETEFVVFATSNGPVLMAKCK